MTFGHPTFRVEKKMFAVLEEYKGELGICLKVGTLLQGVFLDDSRFFARRISASTDGLHCACMRRH
jgi:hypothetical protein